MAKTEQVVEIVRDGAVLVAGVVLVLSTPWLPVAGDREITGALLLLGLLLAGSALWAMGLASRSSHWTHVVLGLVLVAAPWLLVYPSGVTTADVITVAAGAVALVAGLLGVRERRGAVALAA
ncbi:hypothetical protein RHODO2019_03960 [Rhodococcus antarcticus]|jgi:hypothetical protein|uniref:SPW repeat-containing integral membrane domain-containing protein n=1 Tax=Rhodococcus antarcticus TaxID=2987751 RepID=A0ABY6P1U0_9NOCA|nr:hypothetical protein [Rhodococcus antarcticus]UZJ25619.1 hypothetical protein RHODO2019_03960 [Rhodococcus antarcticus]